MSSKYVDNAAITQIIGTVFNYPEILDEEDKYCINEEDFVEEFHKIVFGSILNIHNNDSKVTIDTIIDYLASRPKFEVIFNKNNGVEYIKEASNIAFKDSFNYYYNRMKKFTLLRAYDKIGVDVRFLYDIDNILDVKKKQKQEDWLDNTTLSTIADLIDKKIENIRNKYVDERDNEPFQAGDGVLELIEELRKRPEVGIPMYGSLINTVTRGARLRKFYIRSASTGQGKTRALVADACYFSCEEIYDKRWGTWIKTGKGQPTLFIATEQDKSEIQTMALAFLAEVNEQHILDGKYENDEYERVLKAGEILKNAPLWIEEVPDFSLSDIELIIKKNIRDRDVRYVCYDYIHTSMKILEEITKRSGGVKLREDNALFMLSTKLKDICNQYDVFIISATQLNANY